MNSYLLISAAILLVLVSGCAEDPPELPPPFPDEPVPDNFPGVVYQAHEGDIREPGRSIGPVVLIGIDGVTWDLLQPMIDRGELPVLKDLVLRSAHGVLVSEEPMISPALWATIITGMPRFEHGVVNFMEKRPGSAEAVATGPMDRRSPAVWELVGAAGGSSVAVSWFGSYPAEEMDGIYVSKGIDPENPGVGQVHPEWFSQKLREKAIVSLRRVDLEAIGRSEFLQKTLLEDARTMAVLRVALAEQKPDFTAVYFSGTDVVEHITWNATDPALKDVIPAYHRYIDHILGQIQEMYPAETSFMVVSDHGHGPLQPYNAFHLQLEVLLELLGLGYPQGPAIAISELYRHDKRIWLEPDSASVSIANQIADRLWNLQTDLGVPLFESVLVHADHDGWDPESPAITVRFSSAALMTGFIMDGERSIDFATVRLRHRDVTGEHRPEGVLIAAGPAIRPGRISKPASLYNVAPTLLYLLGLPQDGRMMALAPAEGGVLQEIIDPAFLESNPVTMVEEYPGTDREARIDAGRPADPATRQQMERLRSLGYIR